MIVPLVVSVTGFIISLLIRPVSDRIGKKVDTVNFLFLHNCRFFILDYYIYLFVLFVFVFITFLLYKYALVTFLLKAT